MKHTLDWHIGRSSRGSERLDSQPFVACFYWKQDGVLIESAEYTQPELDRVISEMKRGEPNYDKFLKAKGDLAKAIA
jgi:hypothetical protein